jgi:hypothetical protein
MASSIVLSDNGVTSGSAGIKSTGGNDGVLLLQTTTAGGSATTAVTVDNAQNVGVGVTPSAWLSTARALDIGSRGSLVDWSTSQQTDIWSNGYFNGTNSIYKTTANASIYRQSVGQHIWYNAPSGTAGNAITFTQAMTLDASSNLAVNNTMGRNGLVVYNSVGDVINSHSSRTAGTTYSLFTGFYSATTSAAGTLSFNVTTNGNVTNTNNSYGPISDIKLKENIVDATPKLDDLMKVRIVNYNLKADLGYENHKQIGVIAQELEQVFAGLVDESPDKDEEGNALGTTTKSVKMTVFIPMLIKAIQEQQSLIQSLTDRLTALEGAAK